MYYILNFAHNFSTDSIEKLNELFPNGWEEIDCTKFRWDPKKSLLDQAEELLALQKDMILGGMFVVNVPGLSMATAAILAGIHGISGQFPRVLNLIRREDGVFVVDSVVDLQNVRNEMRFLR